LCARNAEFAALAAQEWNFKDTGAMGAVTVALADALDRHHVTGRVAVALSGGIDSMVLLDAAAVWAKAST
jgi:asparagine synthetase B (glutamine-hydrolysing)